MKFTNAKFLCAPSFQCPHYIYSCTSGASHHVVELLIDAYPAGTRTRDDHEETLPLHLACKWGASEAVLIAIMTTHPEGAIFRDKSGKTPMDHAIKLPTGCIMQQVIKTLELAPLMIAVSKATQRRDTDVTDNRWKGIAEAHSMDIQKWKRQSEQEHEQFKEQERSLRAQMAAVHSESKEKEQALLTQLAAVPLEIKRVEQVLQAQVQDALNQVTALTCSVEATKTELSAVLQSRSDALVELSHAIEALEKKQERICELDKITESQAAVIDELQRLVKTHVQTEQSFVVKVEDLEHSRTELKGDYNRTRGELSTARTENASLRRLLKDANIRVNLCHGRLETVQKWVQSLAFSMDTWTAEKVLVNKCSDHGKMLNMTMVTATPHDNGNSLKSSDTSETEDDISITVMEKVDDKVPKELGLPGN